MFPIRCIEVFDFQVHMGVATTPLVRRVRKKGLVRRGLKLIVVGFIALGQIPFVPMPLSSLPADPKSFRPTALLFLLIGPCLTSLISKLAQLHQSSFSPNRIKFNHQTQHAFCFYCCCCLLLGFVGTLYKWVLHVQWSEENQKAKVKNKHTNTQTSKQKKKKKKNTTKNTNKKTKLNQEQTNTHLPRTQ